MRSFLPEGTRLWIRFLDMLPVFQYQIGAGLPALVLIQLDLKEQAAIGIANRGTGVGYRIRSGSMKIFVIVGGAQYLVFSIPLCLLFTTLDDIFGFHLKNVGEIRAYRQFQ